MSADAPWIAAQTRQLLAQRGHAWLLQGPSGLGQYMLGLNLARAWLAAKMDDAGGSSELRATLSAYRPGLVPERLIKVIDEVREPDLDAAFARWRAVAP